MPNGLASPTPLRRGFYFQRQYGFLKKLLTPIFMRFPEDKKQSPWYVAYTKPRQEEIARVNLERQGLESYLPLYKKFRKTPQGPVGIFEPMFARYIFFRPGQAGQSISVVRSTKGITSLVRFGFEPAVIDDTLLERIRQLEVDRNQATLSELSNLKPGQTVRLRHNALEGVEGLVQNVSSKRVAVLLEILGQPAVVQLEHHQVEPSDG